MNDRVVNTLAAETWNLYTPYAAMTTAIQTSSTEALCLCKNLMYEVLVICNMLKSSTRASFARSGVVIAIAAETFPLLLY